MFIDGAIYNGATCFFPDFSNKCFYKTFSILYPTTWKFVIPILTCDHKILIITFNDSSGSLSFENSSILIIVF